MTELFVLRVSCWTDSGGIGENLTQDGESSAERLNGAGQQGGRLPLAWF